MSQRDLTFEKQIYRMSMVWPNFGLLAWKRQVEAAWIGSLQPTPMSDSYSVRVRLLVGMNPEVRVIAPELRIRNGFQSLPHINPDGSLCLNLLGEWQPWMFLANTTLPWTSSWLYFYEVWQATGAWVGGGTHPDKPEHCSECVFV